MGGGGSVGSQRLSIAPPPSNASPHPDPHLSPPSTHPQTCPYRPHPSKLPLRAASLHPTLHPHLSPVWGRGGVLTLGSLMRRGGVPRARLLSVTCVRAASVCAAPCMRVHGEGGAGSVHEL